MHWTLDVNLKEDDDKKAERRSAKAFSTLKRIALNIVRIKGDRGYKNRKSIRSMIKSAGWHNDNLIKLLV